MSKQLSVLNKALFIQEEMDLLDEPLFTLLFREIYEYEYYIVSNDCSTSMEYLEEIIISFIDKYELDTIPDCEYETYLSVYFMVRLIGYYDEDENVYESNFDMLLEKYKGDPLYGRLHFKFHDYIEFSSDEEEELENFKNYEGSIIPQETISYSRGVIIPPGEYESYMRN